MFVRIDHNTLINSTTICEIARDSNGDLRIETATSTFTLDDPLWINRVLRQLSYTACPESGLERRSYTVTETDGFDNLVELI